MKIKLPIKSLLMLVVLFFMASSSYGQTNELYVGPGTGLDYGGIGGKVEYLPVKNFGFFTGVGFNLLTLGWNVGTTYKIYVSRRVSINPMVMYGYNGVAFTAKEFPEYEMVSYGVTFGTDVNIKFGKRGNKLSAGLCVPIRSKKFMDNFDAMEGDGRVGAVILLPITVSVGYNFKLN